MDAKASDYVSGRLPVRVKFTLSVREGQDTVQASITFQADGLQLLPPGTRVAVNDVELAPERLQKQGYWYKAQLKRSAKYVLQYALAPGRPVQTHEVRDREFTPEIPPTLARGRGAELPFGGPPLAQDERLFVELTGGAGPTKWGVVLTCTLDGNRIIVPASALAQARLGSARLYVGVVQRQSMTIDQLLITRAVGSERAVNMTD